MKCQQCHMEIDLDVGGLCISCWTSSHPLDPKDNIWSWKDKGKKEKTDGSNDQKRAGEAAVIDAEKENTPDVGGTSSGIPTTVPSATPVSVKKRRVKKNSHRIGPGEK